MDFAPICEDQKRQVWRRAAVSCKLSMLLLTLLEEAQFAVVPSQSNVGDLLMNEFGRK